MKLSSQVNENARSNSKSLRAELADLNHCEEPFLSRAAAN